MDNDYTKELELYSQEIEEKVLGALILNNHYYDLIDFLKPEYFYFRQHSMIFKYMSEKFKNNEKIDYLLIKDFFDCEIEKTFENKYTAEDFVKMAEFKKKKEKGLRCLNQIYSKGAIVYLEIKDYALKIKDFYKKRNLKEFLDFSLQEIAKSKTSEHIINDLNSKIDLLDDKTDYKYNINPAKDIAKNRIEEIENCLKKTDRTNNDILKTGFLDFDRKFSGLTKQELVILAGRPSMGKTSLGLQIALNISEQGNNVILFSLEMSKKQLINKILSNKSEINNNKIRQNKIYSEQFKKIKEISIPKSLYINDSAYMNCNLIQKSLRRFVRKNKKVDLVIIDYLQLLKFNKIVKNFNLVHEIGEITKQLKEFSKQFNCCVLCLCQLSRAVESRENKRPLLQDLRDSGNIEQDADVVISCYREHYYKCRELALYEEKKRKGIITEDKYNQLKSYVDYIQYDCELIIGKNRNDGIGNIKIHFKPKFSKFTDVYSKNYLQNDN